MIDEWIVAVGMFLWGVGFTVGATVMVLGGDLMGGGLFIVGLPGMGVGIEQAVELWLEGKGQ